MTNGYIINNSGKSVSDKVALLCTSMSIQSSAPSARSFLSPTSNGYGGNDGQTSAILASYAAAYTKSLPSSKSPNETMNLNPDELFAKHTVSEVRTVQYRLRSAESSYGMRR